MPFCHHHAAGIKPVNFNSLDILNLKSAASRYGNTLWGLIILMLLPSFAYPANDLRVLVVLSFPAESI
jgi:hypothetical protein